MSIRIASNALPLLLLALGTAGCDRRDAEPIEPSDTADTVIDETPATTLPDPTAVDTAVPPPVDAEEDADDAPAE